ncbi:hypothetical protein [Ruegeria lacuscaerulensis]|uniref:hypothetical protein n=1 Tax=Ruegeria lacuscaerulensis TaxID=55218 RepID=UPI00147EDB8D|nr:hypothetical protein [Ruegeria lacuscaerulensis]
MAEALGSLQKTIESGSGKFINDELTIVLDQSDKAALCVTWTRVFVIKYDPLKFRPFTAAELYEARWETPDDAVFVELVDMIPFLEGQRDQWLWIGLIRSLNPDIKGYIDVVTWILDQDDCDVAVAMYAYGCLQGPYACGRPTSRGTSSESEELIPLRVIEARNKSRPYTQNNLLIEQNDFQRGDPDQLLQQSLEYADKMLEKAKKEAEIKGETLREEDFPKPLIAPPVELLQTPLTGHQRRVDYVIDENYAVFVPV